MNNTQLTSAIEMLVEEGEQIVDKHTGPMDTSVDQWKFAKWLPGCRNLLRVLGDAAEPFAEPFGQSAAFCHADRAQEMLASLTALKTAMNHGLLVRIQELVFAEAFSDLIEQAEELAEKGHFLAAGVVCRAVFEEHLRKLCDCNNCMPAGKTTIEPLKQALAKANVLTKLDVRSVDLIASAGNHCAHNNQPPLGESDIRRLIRDVIEFIGHHPL